MKLSIALVAISLCFFPPGNHPHVVTAITGATLVDGTDRAPIRDATVVIEGTRIKQIVTGRTDPALKGAQVINARGKFLIPGLADMHNHLATGTFGFKGQPSNLKVNLRRILGWGITMVFDPGMGSLNDFEELKKASAQDDSGYAHFHGVGRLFTAKGGHGANDGITPDTPGEARAMVRELKAGGVDAIKLVSEDLTYITTKPWPRIKSEVMAAIIDEAHRQGLKAYVHAPILKYAMEALRMGADGLVHGIISDPVDDQFIALMKRNRAIYITTNSIFEAATNVSGWARLEEAFDVRGVFARAVFETGKDRSFGADWESRWDNMAYGKGHMAVLRANLKKVYKAGIPVVMGSDTSDAPVGMLLGPASLAELLLIVESGLTPLQALQTATINAARMVGRDHDQGTIENGKLADIVILDADPLRDIRNVRSIHLVIKGGVVYDPKDLLK
jgi:imidazolonepropionase-like amidohydrolase